MSFERNEFEPEPPALSQGWLQFIESTAERLHINRDHSSVEVPEGTELCPEVARKIVFEHFYDEIHPEAVGFVARALGLQLEAAS